MNYGLYVSASGVLTGLYRLDVAANNLANVNTTAFKPDIAPIQQRQTARVEDGLFSLPSNELLEHLGGGVLAARTLTSFTPAAIKDTGNPLDLAIQGEGFFVVDSGKGDEEARLRFTRDGRFVVNHEGTLVTANEGLPALDEGGAAITIDPSRPVHVGPSGEVTQDGVVLARLQVTALDDPQALRKSAAGLFAVEPGAKPARRAADAVVRSGALEQSGVDPVRTMVAVNHASGAVRNGTRMIQAHDDLMNRAINTFGRVG